MYGQYCQFVRTAFNSVGVLYPILRAKPEAYLSPTSSLASSTGNEGTKKGHKSLILWRAKIEFTTVDWK